MVVHPGAEKWAWKSVTKVAPDSIVILGGTPMRSTVAQAVPTAGLLGKKIAPALTRASLGVSAATTPCSATCHWTLGDAAVGVGELVLHALGLIEDHHHVAGRELFETSAVLPHASLSEVGLSAMPPSNPMPVVELMVPAVTADPPCPPGPAGPRAPAGGAGPRRGVVLRAAPTATRRRRCPRTQGHHRRNHQASSHSALRGAYPLSHS